MQTYLERIRLIKGRILVKVKPNASKTQINSIEDKKIYLDIKAQPEKGKANLELIKFLTRTTKKKVRIISGFNKKEKLVEIS